MWDEGAPAIIPWGALEWHGDHLPLGLDGIVAEDFCDRLADRLNGVRLPGIWLPITTLPHEASLAVRTETLRAILDDTIGGLAVAGARTIIIVTGHFAQGHLIELYEAALRGMEDHEDLRVFAGAPLEPLARPELLDHAAKVEASQLLFVRPDLVDLSKAKEEVVPHRDGVLGESPCRATAEEGARLTEAGLAAWSSWIAEADPGSLEMHYRVAFDGLQAYVDKYYTGSWEEALLRWWADRS